MRRHPEKRRPFILLITVCGTGLVINLLVAWACALWSPCRHGTPLPHYDGPDYPPSWAGGPYNEDGWWQTRWGLGFTEYISLSARGAEGEFRYWRGGLIPYREGGWPLRSFRSTVLAYRDPATGERPRRWDLPSGVILKRGIPTGDLPAFLGGIDERRLPIIPIWPGLLINSLLYGAVIFAALQLFRHDNREIK